MVLKNIICYLCFFNFNIWHDNLIKMMTIYKECKLWMRFIRSVIKKRESFPSAKILFIKNLTSSFINLYLLNVLPKKINIKYKNNLVKKLIVGCLC
jgi:hypothetical protein